MPRFMFCKLCNYLKATGEVGLLAKSVRGKVCSLTKLGLVNLDFFTGLTMTTVPDFYQITIDFLSLIILSYTTVNILCKL